MTIEDDIAFFQRVPTLGVLERDALRLTADDPGTRPEVRVKAKLEADKIDKLLGTLPSQPA